MSKRLFTTFCLKDPGLFRNQGVCFISGKWVSTADTVSVYNPSNGKTIGQVAQATVSLVETCIEEANRAQMLWASTPARQRSKVLQRMAQLHHVHEEDLAQIMTLEQGKPMQESREEIRYAASYYEWFAGECLRTYGDIIPSPAPHSRKLLVTHQPVGVVAGITPWNFPSAMIARKLAPALAAGCSFVLKPSGLTPFSALAICELAQRSGLPAGLLHCVTGKSSDIGHEFTRNRTVRKISFTGSTAVGKQLLRKGSESVKRMSMELGGNAPFVVFEDCELEKAALGLYHSKFRNMGQTCICTNRVFVQEAVYERFLEVFTELVKEKAVLGDGFDPSCTQGPLISQSAVEKVQQHISDALEKGGKIVLGGKLSAIGDRFFEPTIIRDASPSMLCFREETFGPLAALSRFRTEEEVVSLCNSTESGLAAYVFTQDSGRAWRMMEMLEFGMVGVNTGQISSEVVPFGGVKESGLGREGSKYGMQEYLETKYACWEV